MQRRLGRSPPFPLVLLQHKTERLRDSSGEAERQGGEEGAIGEDMICQPKEDDKEFECERAVGTDLPTYASSREDVGLSPSVSDRERPEGGQIRSK